MNITVNGQDLMRQLAFLNCVKSGSPDEMLIDTVGDNLLRLAVSCQETTASAVLPIVSSSGEMPQPSVSVARLRRVKLAPMAKLELNHQGIRLTSGESHYWLSSTNSSLLQKKLACAPFSEQYTVGGEVLNLVRRVRKASARREANKYRMAGVWVELAESRIYVRASNGFQAMEACMPHKPTPKQEFFLPNKAVAPLLQMLPSSGTCALRIGISEKSIAFHAQERTLQVQRLLGIRPPFEEIFQGEQSAAQISAALLKNTAKRLAAISLTTHPAVHLATGDGKLMLSVHSEAAWELKESIAIACGSAHLDCHVLLLPLIDSLKAFRTAIVLCDGAKGVVIRDENSRCVLAKVKNVLPPQK